MSLDQTATKLFDQAFGGSRDIRSDAYKAGVFAALKFKCGEALQIPHPYEAGTAEADAYSAGVEEGYLIHRRAMADKWKWEAGQ